jgi:hypothetical protein
VYDNIHDADMRLSGTMIRYKNCAFLCKSVFMGVDSSIHLRLIPCTHTLTKKAYLDVPLHSPNLDFSSPPLGYIPYPFNWGKGWAYAVRMPARRQQQGVVVARIIVHECGRPEKKLRNFSDHTDVGKCIEGIYPDPSDYAATYNAMYENFVFPFTRDIAASPSYLYYRAHIVGEIARDGDFFNVKIVSPSFRYYYFKEVFDENWRFDWA